MEQVKSMFECINCTKTLYDCTCAATCMLFRAILSMECTTPVSYEIATISNYLKMGADFNRPIIYFKLNGCTSKLNIFTYICGNGTKEIVNLFIQYGANVNNILFCTDFNKTPHKYYPVMYAIHKLNKDTVEALINAGANIPESSKALYYTVKRKSYDITKILLDYGAKVDESVMQLVESNYDNAIIKKLITDAVQVQSRKRLREPSLEVIQKRPSFATEKDIKETISNSPFLTEEDKKIIILFFSKYGFPKTTPERRMKLCEIVTPQGIENFFLILRFEDMTYQQTHKFVKNIETKKVIDLTHL